MIQPRYQWKILPNDRDAAAELERKLKLPSLVASLLVTRGLTDADEAAAFLKGTMGDLHDPFLLSGMREAVPRIRKALEHGERILIYGDYDADGVSSTALMICLMRHLKADFEYYIPHRSKEGYGLHLPPLQQARERGVTLVITVDTGISAFEQIAFAKEAGMDVIVTDHHEPPARLPEAFALINPKLPYCPYPFKGLAGVGVAYKLATALLGKEVPASWTELAALGTIADLMPLTGENRAIVRSGLASMADSPFPGMTALLKIAGWKAGEVTAMNVAFGLAPRINASGRMSHADRAVKLLVTELAEEAEAAALELDILNKERQELVEQIVQEALLGLEAKAAAGKLPDVIVVAGEGWNVGVVGIVASKILERYYRPTLVLGIHPETGECKGSARSIPGFDIYEALTECADLLDHFGGHPSAAGMSLSRENLADFERRLNEFAAGVLKPEHFVPTMVNDLECSLSDITLSVIEQMETLAPFGMGNPCPRLLIRGAKLVDCKPIGKDGKHLRLTVAQNNTTMEAVAFGKGELAIMLAEEAELDIVAEAGINEWNGSRKPQLLIQDIAVSHLQVHDFRGFGKPAAKLNELTEELLKCPGFRAESVAALLNPDSEILERPELNPASLWVYDRRVGAVPAKSRDPETGAREVTTLFLLELPKTPVDWNRILGLFGALERVYLLHPKTPPQELLEPPTRDQFKQVYALLRSFAAEGQPEEKLISAMMARTRLSRRMLALTMDVFEELGFIARTSGIVTVMPSPSKRPLESSARYMELGLLAETEQMLLRAKVSQITEWLQTRIQGAS
ncbi:single-stranded-DNA-specific exonuclease RecJ [Paenibacillus sanfengchensis]|uniref:single-stranded-DNA-specific exonuclease RecJ n=1 Tax=Paenibacillus sanfengchensis TaxID=3119819 RepID=UPI002FE39F52